MSLEQQCACTHGYAYHAPGLRWVPSASALVRAASSWRLPADSEVHLPFAGLAPERRSPTRWWVPKHRVPLGLVVQPKHASSITDPSEVGTRVRHLRFAGGSLHRSHRCFQQPDTHVRNGITPCYSEAGPEARGTRDWFRPWSRWSWEEGSHACG